MGDRKKDDRQGLENIQKRAMKVENTYYQSFATYDINPMNSFAERHYKALTYLAVETSHNTFFHFIETVKVRGQARNLVSGDISHYFKNQVEKKPLISGVVSGFFGSAIGALTFWTLHDYLTLKLYCHSPSQVNNGVLGRMQQWDFRVKNIAIFAASDFCASVTKLMFEVRKQQIQMYSHDLGLAFIARSAMLSWAPLMLRDVMFRFVQLSFFYATTNIEHKPKLIYTIPQITDFMR